MLVFLCFVSFVVHTVTCFWSLYCCCGLMAHRKYFLLFSLSLFPASLHLANDLSSFLFLIKKKKCQSFCHPPCNYLLIPNFNSMLLVSKYPRSQELHVLSPTLHFIDTEQMIDLSCCLFSCQPLIYSFILRYMPLRKNYSFWISALSTFQSISTQTCTNSILMNKKWRWE